MRVPVDQTVLVDSSHPSSDDMFPKPKFTVKLSTDWPAGQFYPSSDIVQASGTSYCPSINEIGTLGVRVDTPDTTKFHFIATYHNFAENQTDFMWVYNHGDVVWAGNTGTIINRNYSWGPNHTHPTLDCVLIELNTTSPASVAPGISQGTGVTPVKVKGTGYARPGMVVKKFGMKTGLTYGVVVPLPSDFVPFYADYLFAVQLSNSTGSPIDGDFSGQGDSGSAIVDQFGHVLGLLIQGWNGLTIINRIDKIEKALGVRVHKD